MDKKVYDEFFSYLEKQDKANSVNLIIDLLEADTLVKDIYSYLITPAMNSITCKEVDKSLCVWKEHVTTSMIRTILEICYPYVLRQKEKLNLVKKVAVICPDGEHHEIGARMASDFFELNGFETLYVGANTPKEEFLGVVNTIRPEYIAISVTNVYNLFQAKKTIDMIKDRVDYPIEVIAGGRAFFHKKDSYKEVGADYFFENYDAIVAFSKEVTEK